MYPNMRKMYSYFLSLYADYAPLFVLLLNTLMSVKTRCVLSASASQHPQILLVINRMYLIREYTVLIGDPIAVQILSHNPSLSCVLRYPVAFESPHAPKLTVINRTCHVHLLHELSRILTACSTATQTPLQYSTYIVLFFDTIDESVFCILQTNILYVRLFRLLTTFSRQHFCLTFERR